jgi:hypothetical protein
MPEPAPNPATSGVATEQYLTDEQYWTEVEAAYERLQRDPTGWAEYLAELAEWEAGTTDADPTAVEEWPEYNR